MFLKPRMVFNLIKSSKKDLNRVRREALLDAFQKRDLIESSYRKLEKIDDFYIGDLPMLKKLEKLQYKIFNLVIKYLDQLSLLQAKKRSFFLKPYYYFRTFFFAKKSHILRKYAQVYEMQKKLNILINAPMNINSKEKSQAYSNIDYGKKITCHLLKKHYYNNRKQVIYKKFEQTFFCCTRSECGKTKKEIEEFVKQNSEFSIPELKL